MKLSIKYLKESHDEISNHSVLYLRRVCFRQTNGADHGEMPPYAAFHLGLHRLPKYPLMVLGPDYNASLTLRKTSVKY